MIYKFVIFATNEKMEGGNAHKKHEKSPKVHYLPINCRKYDHYREGSK